MLKSYGTTTAPRLISDWYHLLYVIGIIAHTGIK